MLPCGTPDAGAEVVDDLVLSSSTYCSLFDKYDLMMSKDLPFIPRLENFLNIRSCRSKSKALDISRKTEQT